MDRKNIVNMRQRGKTRAQKQNDTRMQYTLEQREAVNRLQKHRRENRVTLKLQKTSSTAETPTVILLVVNFHIVHS